jgi:rRNA-processing protein EBP2
VNHKLERQKKLQKEAEKRKRQKRSSSIDVAALEDEVAEPEDVESAQPKKLGRKEKKAAKKAHRLPETNGEADDWETDGSEDEGNQDVGADIGPLSDESESDSEIDGDDNGDEGEDGDEDDEDIPLSDIESLASEDRADVIPHQRLTINNTAALQRSLKSFALPASLPFSAVQSVTSAEPVEIKDAEDDLNRELAFYRQSLDAVTEARARLKAEGKPFSRPTDYFAEMVKSEEQMGKVRAKMLDEAARKKASADARRQRDLKKFGKAVQVAKLQERQKEKKETLDRIQTLKRSEYSCGRDDAGEIGLILIYCRTSGGRPHYKRRRHVRRCARRRRSDGEERSCRSKGQRRGSKPQAAEKG